MDKVIRKKIFLLCCLVSVTLFSQNHKHTYELIGGVGPSGFLGDLGGASSNGTHFVKDYNLFSTRYCLNSGIRKKINSKFAVKSMLSFAMVSGDDALSKDFIRKNRNLNFRSPIFEGSVQAEYYFLHDKFNYGEPTHRLNLKTKKRTLTAYTEDQKAYQCYSRAGDTEMSKIAGKAMTLCQTMYGSINPTIRKF